MHFRRYLPISRLSLQRRRSWLRNRRWRLDDGEEHHDRGRRGHGQPLDHRTTEHERDERGDEAGMQDDRRREAAARVPFLRFDEELIAEPVAAAGALGGTRAVLTRLPRRTPFRLRWRQPKGVQRHDVGRHQQIAHAGDGRIVALERRKQPHGLDSIDRRVAGFSEKSSCAPL